MRTTRAGNWSDSIWDTSGGDREISHKVTLDRDVTSNERVFVTSTGTLDIQAVLTMNNKNLTNEGVVYSRPNGKKRGIRFININEQIVVGGGMAELFTDVGYWVFMAGKTDIEGTFKTPYTFVTGSAKKGETFVNVLNVDGWKVGDEIVIGTMEEPFGDSQIGWNETDTVFNDEFFKRFEKKTVTSITGNKVSFSQGLVYDHDLVLTGYGVTHTCPVVNLTRDFVIEGTPNGRSHMFHTAHTRAGAHTQHAVVPHNIKNIEGRFLGQRKGLGRNSNLITGRYPLHFHHNGDSSKGTMISGCSFHQIGNRCYVPHMSNGITMQNNTVFDCLSMGFWWDDRENSHDIIWDGNMAMACRPAGDGSRGEGFLLGMGDNNKCINNFVYYCNGTEIHNNNGGYAWNADSEGIWVFFNNKAFACSVGLFVWQNTGTNHTIVDFEAVNCIEAVQHGAYINSYGYLNCKFCRAPIFVEASSGNSYGVVWKDCIFDAGGKKYGGRGVDSPAGSDPTKTNKFINSKFIGHTVAGMEFASDLPFSNPEKQVKFFDFIGCEHTGLLYKFVHDHPEPLKDGWRVRVQPKSGQSTQTVRQNQQDVTSNIGDFAARLWGTGTGLKGEYYLGTAFNEKRFERIDSMIMFQGWRPDPKYAPYGVHHLLQGDLYSIRWTGLIEAQYTESYVFHFEGSGGHRLRVNNILILDSWVEKAENNKIVASSSAINLKAGEKVNITIEHFNSSGERGCLFYWKSNSLPVISIVPMSQMYSDTIISPPPIPPDMPDCITLVPADYLLMFKDLRDNGITLATALQHYNTFGKKEGRRPNLLCRDPNLTPNLVELDKIIAGQPPVGKTLKSTIKVYSDGTIEVV